MLISSAVAYFIVRKLRARSKGFNRFVLKIERNFAMATGGIRRCMRDTTPYLAMLMGIVTLGPLLFGFHLVK